MAAPRSPTGPSPSRSQPSPDKASSRPARPRDAASVILVDRANGKPFVLMGRRPARSKFIPDAYVFPGGAVDRPDRDAGVASLLDPSAVETLCVAGDSRRAHGLAVAAVRETFEETGLLLAAPGDVGDAEGETWQALRERALAPDLTRLTYFARAITPSFSPRRFHARFFLADASDARGSIVETGELLDLKWVTIDEGARLPTVDVTQFMLAELGRYFAGEAPPRYPLWCYRRGKARIR